MKRRLFSPGPTPVPEDVLLHMARPIQHHRLPAFEEIFMKATDLLGKLFKTDQPVLTITSSGTSAMEAAICNLLSPGDEVIVVRGGKFGERWGDISESYGISVHPIDIEWGQSVPPDRIGKELEKHPAAKAVCTTQCETSTGALTDIQAIGQAIEGSDALLIVDGITGIGVHDFRFDEWGVDAAVTGSQKGLMVPPGLAFIALSERATNALNDSKCPKYYLDLDKYIKSLGKRQTPWTPGISLIVGLTRALELIFEEGLEALFARHQRLADATRAGARALGMKILSENPSNVLTALFIPESIDGEKFMSYIRNEMGIMVAGGQGHLKGKIFRIAHVGYFDDFDILVSMAALERSLLHCGHDITIGSGLAAAHEELIRSF